MTLKQLQARNAALSDEVNTLRHMLNEQRAGRSAQRAQRLRNSRIAAKHYRGEQLCLD